MPSPLVAITHRWALGGDYLDKVGNKNFTGSGSITQVAGQIPSSVASLFGAAYADNMTIAHDGASDLDFTTDFTLFLFVKLATGSGNVYPISKGQWYGFFEMAVSSTNGAVGLLLGNGTANTSPIAAAAYGNNTLVNGEWGFIGVRHKASTQEVWLYAGRAQRGDGLQCLYRKYTTTRNRSTLPLRLNGLSNSSGSVQGVAPYTMQEVNFAPTLLTEFDMLAAYNQGQGILPPYSAYQTQGQVPGLSTETRYVISGLPYSRSIAQVWKSAAQTDTTRTDPINVPYPITGLQVGWVNAVTGSAGGEQFTPANQGSVTIQAAVYVEGEDAPIQLTFGGNTSVTIPYGSVVYCDPITSRIFYSNQNLRFTTFYTYSSGAIVPGSIQFSADGGRFGSTANNVLNITTASFATDRGSYGFGPTLYRGKAVAPASYDMDVVVRGDSLTANVDTAYYKKGLNSGRSHQYLGVASMSTNTYASNPNTDLAGTAITLAASVVVEELATNDARQGTRTGPQIVADKTICWTRWLGTGSNARKLIVPTLYPITEAGNIAAAAASRKYWNDYLRGLTNAQAGAMTGRPCLVYQWNWSTGQWVATAGGRSGGSGQPLDIYVEDMAYITENNSVTSDNVWNTTVAPNKVVISAGTISDGIHPIAVDSTNIAAVAQTPYNAAMTAALPAAYNITNVTIDQPDQTTTVSGTINFTATQTYTGSVPPAPVWSVTNVSGRVGTTNPATGVYTPNPLVGATPNVDTVTATSANGLTSSRTVTTPAAGSGSGRKKFVGKMTTNPTITTGTWVPITTNGNGFSVSPRNGTVEVFFKTAPPAASDLGEPIEQGNFREFGEPAAGTIAYLRAISFDCKVALTV